VLFVVAIVAVFAVWASMRLRIENDLASLLPKGIESVRAMNELRDTFGGLGHLMIVIEAPDPRQSEAFADRLESKISSHPSVHYVVHRKPVGYFKDRLWLYADHADLLEVERRIEHALELEKKGVSPVFNDLMDFADEDDRIDLSFEDLIAKYRGRYGLGASAEAVSDDGTLRVLQVKLKNNPQSLDQTKKLLADFGKMEAELLSDSKFQGVKVGHTGSYQKMIEQAEFTRDEILRVCSIVTLLLFLILLAYFRDPLSALLISIPISVGVAWTGGFVALALGHLNVITSFAAAILAGLGSDYGIYLLSRYRRERASGRSFEEACRLAFSQTGRATYLSMLTTAGGFAALLLSKFSLFFEFGVVGAAGLVLSWIAMVVLLPAFLALEDRWRKSPKPLADWRFWGTLSKLFVPKFLGASVAVFALLCVVSLGGLGFVSKIHFDDGQVESRELSSYQLAEKIRPLFPLSTTPTVLLVKGQEPEREVVRAAQQALGKPDAVFDHVLGLSLFLPEDQSAKKDILERIRSKAEKVKKSFGPRKGEFLSSIDSSLESPPVTSESLPREVARAFRSPTQDDVFAVTLNPSFGRISAETMKAYREGVEKFRSDYHLNFTAADNTFVSNDLITMVEHEAPRIFSLFLIFLTGVLMLHVRPWRKGLLIAGHLISGLILLAGLLSVFSIELNIINIAMLPVILGTAVDSFLHLGESLEGAQDPGGVLREEVPSILVSNLTSLVGFGGLIFTSSAGIRSAGWVATLGILMVTLICTYVFPRSWLLAGHGPQAPDDAEDAEGVVEI